MEGVKTFFFDAYALYEIVAGNKKYEKYTKGAAIVTTKLNLMELHYGLLSLFGKEKADNMFDELVQYTQEVDNNTIKEASLLRFSLKKRNLSYVDCIGYTIAKKMNIQFLTGDMQFKDLDNVEFVAAK